MGIDRYFGVRRRIPLFFSRRAFLDVIIEQLLARVCVYREGLLALRNSL